MTDPLERIAAALDRLSPPPLAAADPMTEAAYVWRAGVLSAARAFNPLPLELLIGIDRQKDAMVANLARFAAGFAAHDALLWGARGTGKSALVKSAVAAVRHAGATCALVEVADVATLPTLFAVLARVPRRFVLFIDDFGVDDPAEARRLRSLLGGGAEARPDHVRLVVTANRRHLTPRGIADADAAVNPRDVADDQLALADRFGISLGFHVPDQESYLAIVTAYARRYALSFTTDEAIGWAAGRGNRSGRTAWQYVVELAGRAGRALPIA